MLAELADGQAGGWYSLKSGISYKIAEPLNYALYFCKSLIIGFFTILIKILSAQCVLLFKVHALEGSTYNDN